MKWSENAWSAVEEIYEDILELSFIEELTDGTLSDEQFMFYIIQDAHYLKVYIKLLESISQNLTNPEHSEVFKKFIQDGIAVENALHDTYLKDYNLSEIKKSECCELYIQHLNNSIESEIVEIQLAAALPCFWIYQKVGEHIFNNSVKNNKFQNWINTYSDKAFEESTQKAIEICDEVANSCKEPELIELMTSAFVLSTKLEKLFWKSAYYFEEIN